MKIRSFALVTLGCKVNQYEGEKLAELLERAGLVQIPYDGVADLYIVNSCAVTSVAEAKSRALVSRARRKNPAGKILLVGCAATRNMMGGESPEKKYDFLIPQNEKFRLLEFLENEGWLKQTDKHGAHAEPGNNTETVPVLSSSDDAPPVIISGAMYKPRHGMSDTSFSREKSAANLFSRTRKLVKVQDGCNSMCSYCIVPLLRGRSRSRYLDEIKKEVVEHEKTGVPECVITGIHLGQYRCPETGCDLSGLLHELLSATKRIRFRLSSIEQGEITESLLCLMEGSGRIARHLHIPLQSGSARILKLMNRLYEPGMWLEKITFCHSRIKNLAIAADVIVGFPGETEKDFEETRKLIEKAPLYDLHIFRYSRRPGTRASSMQPDVPEEIKKKRSLILEGLRKEKIKAFHFLNLGLEHQILIEQEKNGCLTGYTDNYIRVELELTENKQSINTSLEKNYIGSYVKVKLVADLGESMRGILIR